MDGQVVHFEIPADDMARAKQFYLSTFGWGLEDVPNMEYTMVRTVEVGDDHLPKTKGAINGGMAPRSETLKAPVVTISVSSIEDTIAKVTASGGSEVAPKTEVMGMGYTAYVKDTEGNTIGLWQAIPQ
ncbi:MAG TPA: VOC family protein [Candidatus Acidoferrum sp.]|nr:VOC family protein [Candidatus Acidoferrum sp.]